MILEIHSIVSDLKVKIAHMEATLENHSDHSKRINDLEKKHENLLGKVSVVVIAVGGFFTYIWEVIIGKH